jgi:hypothetical protein
MIGLEIAPLLEAAAKQRMLEGGRKGRKQAARRRLNRAPPNGGEAKKKRYDGEVTRQISKAVGVGYNTVGKAKKVKASSPRLARLPPARRRIALALSAR